jgi:L-aspartate semialdehyde sulfurtransferase
LVLTSTMPWSAGQLSPLLKDPLYKTIGMGTRIFLGGGIGYVAWYGTQHNPDVLRSDDGLPRAPGGTLAVTGDARQMDQKFVTGASFTGYGTTLAIGVGVPIPVLDEEIAYFTSRSDSDLVAQIVDYSNDYPNRIAKSLGEVSYAQLKTGKVLFNGQEIRTVPISSYAKGLEIANLLKDWIGSGRFTLSSPVAPLPTAGSGIVMKPLEEIRPREVVNVSAN